MSDIKSIIRLNCNEEIDVKYFSKDESITDTTLDYSELLEYINEIEDKNERLNTELKLYKDNNKHLNKLLEQLENYIFELKTNSDENCFDRLLEIIQGVDKE